MEELVSEARFTNNELELFNIQGLKPKNWESFRVTKFSTPLGYMVAAENENKLVLLDFLDSKNLTKKMITLYRKTGSLFRLRSCNLFNQLQEELNQYFNKKLTSFSVPVMLIGTEFQQKIWTELMKVDYDQKLSYTDIAERIGKANAVRAVAREIANNKVLLIVPCHRIIGKNGNLTGYSSGLERKKQLLQLEKNRSTF